MRRKAVIVCGVGLLAILFFALDLQQYLSIATIKARHAELLELYGRQPALFIAAFMALQIAALTLSLPGAVLSFALAGGAIFGPLAGTAIVLVSLTIGDSLGLLVARYLLRDWVERRFGGQARAFERGIEKDGAFYLLSLRLMAIVPYFVVNFAMGLTRMPVRIFAPASFVGLAPATALYVNAGTQLARIDRPADVLSAQLVVSFVLLGLLPIAARFALRRRQT